MYPNRLAFPLPLNVLQMPTLFRVSGPSSTKGGIYHRRTFRASKQIQPTQVLGGYGGRPNKGRAARWEQLLDIWCSSGLSHRFECALELYPLLQIPTVVRDYVFDLGFHGKYLLFS